MICLKSAGNETHLLKKSVDSSNDTRPHESHISELRLGHLEIGKVVMDVDLNFEMRRVEMKEVIKKAFTQSNFDPKRPYLEKIGPAYLEEKLKEFRELFSAIAPPMMALTYCRSSGTLTPTTTCGRFETGARRIRQSN
ncbi:unnamed protein product, partial [Mesorhabditis belari]|uniref:Uncharacterized protein n=1 Tax=Mesorhabditis belari TaxID=2138241 RepID=A0AAF3F5K5_9BILA